MSHKPLSVALLLALSALVAPAFAIDSTLTYQGSLEDAGQPANGVYDLQFDLQDANAASVGQLSRDDVQVSGGVFTVTLDFGPTAFTGADRFLAISVRPGASTGAYTRLSPRSTVTPVPYAQLADDANFAASVANDSIGAVQVIDNSLTRFDIGTAAIGSDELTSDAVTTAKLQDGAVSGAKLQDSAVTNLKLAAGSVSGDRIATGGVTSLAVADDSLGSADIGPNAVGLAEVKSAEVQLRVSGSCTTGSAITAVNSNGTVSCADVDANVWSTAGNAVSGSPFLGTTNTAALTLRADNKRIALFQPDAIAPNVILGMETNSIAAGVRGAFVAGGSLLAEPEFSAVGPNAVLDAYGVIGGGAGNQAGNSTSGNDAAFAVVAGGRGNHAGGLASTVSGGAINLAMGAHAAVMGGTLNSAPGKAASTGGGQANCAGGAYSFAAGFGAKVRPSNALSNVGTGCNTFNTSPLADGDAGTFIWNDGSGGVFVSTGPNQFLLRAQGGMALNTTPQDANVELTVAADTDGPDYANLWLKQRTSDNGVVMSVGDGTGSNNNAGFYLDQYNGTTQVRRLSLSMDGSVQIRSSVSGANTGVTMAANAGSWSSLSDRNAKTAIVAVDPQEVLASVAALPISTWRYTAQGDGIRHMGPMAQDFAAAFGLGEDDTHISTVDIDGVALAAIQGLNAKLESENAQLRDRLARLEATMASSAAR